MIVLFFFAFFGGCFVVVSVSNAKVALCTLFIITTVCSTPLLIVFFFAALGEGFESMIESPRDLEILQ